jgi:hypothetical protein
MQTEISTTDYEKPDRYSKVVEAFFVTPNNLVAVASWCGGRAVESEDPVTFQTTSYVEFGNGEVKNKCPVWCYLVKDKLSMSGFVVYNQIAFENEYKEIKNEE